MKIKTGYEDHLRELFFFGDDLDNWKIKTTIDDFIHLYVDYSGNEAEEIKNRITPIRAARGSSNSKKKWLDELTQEKFERDPLSTIQNSKSYIVDSYYLDGEYQSTWREDWYKKYSFYPVYRKLLNISSRFKTKSNIDFIKSMYFALAQLRENQSFIFDKSDKDCLGFTFDDFNVGTKTNKKEEN